MGGASLSEVNPAVDGSARVAHVVVFRSRLIVESALDLDATGFRKPIANDTSAMSRSLTFFGLAMRSSIAISPSATIGTTCSRRRHMLPVTFPTERYGRQHRSHQTSGAAHAKGFDVALNTAGSAAPSRPNASHPKQLTES